MSIGAITKKPRTKPRMKHVAEVAGVAASTVSMALSDSPEISEETKTRVRKACETLGYPLNPSVSSRQGRGNGSRQLGFLSLGVSLDEPSLSGILQAFAVMGAQEDVRVEIAARESVEDVEETFACLASLAKTVNGVILFGIAEPALQERIREAGLRCVLIGRPPTRPGDAQDLAPTIPFVHNDEVGMGRAATHWLQRRGHRCIGFVCSRLIEGMYDALWRDGYYLAQLDAGCSPSPELVCASGIEADARQRMVDHFLALPQRPTAFVVPDPYLAMHLKAGLQEAGYPIRDRDMVLSASPGKAMQVGLSTCASICPDFERLACAAVSLLELPSATAHSIHAPLLTCNLTHEDL